MKRLQQTLYCITCITMYHYVSLSSEHVATCAYLRYILNLVNTGEGVEVTLSCNISASQALVAPIQLFSFALILQSQVLLCSSSVLVETCPESPDS